MGDMFDETEKIKIEGFLAMTQIFERHHKANDSRCACEKCEYMRPRLEALQRKVIGYAEMRKTDDDIIEWNVLIFELLNEYGEEERIDIPTPPKRAKMTENEPKVEKGEEENIGPKIEKLLAEKKAKEEADKFYDLEVDSFDDDDFEESGEDQVEDEEDEEQEEAPEEMEGVVEQTELQKQNEGVEDGQENKEREQATKPSKVF